MVFGIIGYGNLGKALVKGLVCIGVNQKDIVINARTEQTRNLVKEEFKDIYVTESKKELLDKADVLIIVVEPKNSEEVLKEIGTYDISDKIIVSFMAGITREKIRYMLGEQGINTKIVRVMPNIAISNGNGILGITYDDTDYETIRDAIRIFEKLGYMLRVDEISLDHVTVMAASGLAFVACLMKSYQQAGNILFNDDMQSKEITLRVFENVIEMVKREKCSFDEIINRITTKGGTTEAGMKCLNQDIITETLKECINASYEKSKNI